MSNTTTPELIDRLAELKAQQDAIKRERDAIETTLLKRAEEDLANTKYKTKTYAGSRARLIATTAETVKVTYEAFLPVIFGAAYKEMCNSKSTVELTSPAKRLIAGIWTGNYMPMTVAEVIAQIPLEEKNAKLVSKRCKGNNYDRDKEQLIAAGLSDEDAAEDAYMIYEAAIWQRFTALLELNGIKDEAQIAELLVKIQAAFVVEETPKITLEV